MDRVKRQESKIKQADSKTVNKSNSQQNKLTRHNHNEVDEWKN